MNTAVHKITDGQALKGGKKSFLSPAKFVTRKDRFKALINQSCVSSFMSAQCSLTKPHYPEKDIAEAETKPGYKSESSALPHTCKSLACSFVVTVTT